MHALLVPLLAALSGAAPALPKAPHAQAIHHSTTRRSSPPPRGQARLRNPERERRAPGKSTMRHRVRYPLVELHAVNLDESLAWRPYDDRGRTRRASDRELTRLFRCYHDGKQHRVDPRLGRVLYQVARHYPGHRIEIYSGYRPRAYCTLAHSRHLTASAIDFRIDGVKNEALIAWLRATFHPVGVGYYPNGIHVHLDVDRTHDTYWVDPGAPAAAPLVAIGDSAPDAIEASGDETVAPEEAAEGPTEPPLDDPAIDE
ncbi:MAG TPA: DUF882 domain-containing protein [Polyangia bacterium]